RDKLVTGVQTCALPISDAQVAGSSDGVTDSADPEAGERDDAALRAAYVAAELGIRTPQFNAELGRIAQQETQRWLGLGNDASVRSEERRVGKEGRGRWA